MSGVSFAFLTASWNFFSNTSEGVFLGFDGLAEDRIATRILLLHGTGGLFNVIEGFHPGRGSVAYYDFVIGVYFEDGTTTGAGNLEG